MPRPLQGAPIPAPSTPLNLGSFKPETPVALSHQRNGGCCCCGGETTGGTPGRAGLGTLVPPQSGYPPRPGSPSTLQSPETVQPSLLSPWRLGLGRPAHGDGNPSWVGSPGGVPGRNGERPTRAPPSVGVVHSSRTLARTGRQGDALACGPGRPPRRGTGLSGAGTQPF